MPGGKRNPFSVTHILESLGDAVQNAKVKSETHSSHLAGVLGKVEQKLPELLPGTSFVDIKIKFIGASGLPKMDVVGTADPYFVAKIDNRISFVSKVIRNSLAPVWDEIWCVKNVPTTATLRVTVMDKDEGAVTDDYIGSFETSVSAGAKEVEINGPLFHRARGSLWLKIDTTPSEDKSNAMRFPYLFDGPIRYSIHFSPTVGLLTNLDEARLYSTWKMYIRGVSLFFRDTHQPWNRKYKAAQNIFQGPTSVAVRSGIQAGHRMLYARTAANGFGIIQKSTDVINILHGGASRPGSQNASIQMQHAGRVKPAVYTYIISSDDDSFRFSETGAAFFVDFASKHALHSNCAETVRYSGEFHPRPKGGWQNFSESTPDAEAEWELVIDNNSGTYAPDPLMLPELKELLEYNFPDFHVNAWDREDPRLKESVDACREYAMKYRAVGKDELQPTADEGEVTLMHQASLKLAAQDGQGGEEGEQHQRYSSNASSGSGGGSVGESTGEPHVSVSQMPLQPQRYTGEDQHAPPSLPPRPAPDGSPPRTSSDYLKGDHHNSGGAYPGVGGDGTGTYGSGGHEVPPPRLSPSPSGTGSRPVSQDFSTLPPGCAPPVKFLPGEAPPSGSAAAGYSYNMSRYDPGRR